VREGDFFSYVVGRITDDHTVAGDERISLRD
jgi:hypothetical protein